MKELLEKNAENVTAVLSGFDRLLFRGTIRMLSAPQGMRSYLWHERVLLTEFGAHALKVSTGLKDAVVAAVEQALKDPLISTERVWHRNYRENMIEIAAT